MVKNLIQLAAAMFVIVVVIVLWVVCGVIAGIDALNTLL